MFQIFYRTVLCYVDIDNYYDFRSITSINPYLYLCEYNVLSLFSPSK